MEDGVAVISNTVNTLSCDLSSSPQSGSDIEHIRGVLMEEGQKSDGAAEFGSSSLILCLFPIHPGFRVSRRSQMPLGEPQQCVQSTLTG